MVRREIAIAVAALGAGILGMGQGNSPATGAKGTQPKLPFTISKETTGITGPLNADGAPDYVAALNEKYGKGVTPENNAFVAWLKVADTRKDIANNVRARFLKMCGGEETQVESGILKGYEQYLTEKGLSEQQVSPRVAELDDAGAKLWREEALVEIAEYLKSQEGPLNAVVEGVKRPNWWLPYVSDPDGSTFNMVFPSLGRMRDAGRALCARATLREQSGNFEGFKADVIAAKQLARHVGSGCSLLERLVGAAIDAKANAAIGAAAGSGKLSEVECLTMLREMRALGPQPDLIEAVDVADRWCIVQNVVFTAQGQLHFLPNGPASGVADVDDAIREMKLVFGTVQRSDVEWDIVLKFINRTYDEQVKGLRAVTTAKMREEVNASDASIERWRRVINAAPGMQTEKGMAMEPGETRAAYTARVGMAIVLAQKSDYLRAGLIQRQTAMQTEMAASLLAAGMERARKGSWPTALPLAEGQTEVARDVFSEVEHAVKYVVVNDSARVYSVGRNGKDDEGINDQASGKDDIVVGAK